MFRATYLSANSFACVFLKEQRINGEPQSVASPNPARAASSRYITISWRASVILSGIHPWVFGKSPRPTLETIRSRTGRDYADSGEYSNRMFYNNVSLILFYLFFFHTLHDEFYSRRFEAFYAIVAYILREKSQRLK